MDTGTATYISRDTPVAISMGELSNLITTQNVHNLLNEISNGYQVEDPVIQSLSIVMEDYLQDVLLNAYQMCRHRYSKVITPQDVWYYLNITDSSPIEPLAGLGATMGLGAVISLIAGSDFKDKADKTKSMVNYLQLPRSNYSLSHVLNRGSGGRNNRKIASAAAEQRRILSSYFSDPETNKTDEIAIRKIRTRNHTHLHTSTGSETDSISVISFVSDSQ